MTAQQHKAIRYHQGVAGLGVTSQQLTSTIGSGLMSAAGIMAAVGGPVGAIAGAITAAVGSLTVLIGGMFKPDLTKIQATHIVDQIELQVLKPLVAAWNALPPERKTRSLQAELLKTFDDAWAAVQQGCSNPQLGTAGQSCISDRLRTGPWPWPVYYRDPIANDPNVVPDPIESSPIDLFLGGSTSGVGLGVPLLIGGALIAVALAMGD